MIGPFINCNFSFNLSYSSPSFFPHLCCLCTSWYSRSSPQCHHRNSNPTGQTDNEKCIIHTHVCSVYWCQYCLTLMMYQINGNLLFRLQILISLWTLVVFKSGINCLDGHRGHLSMDGRICTFHFFGKKTPFGSCLFDSVATIMTIICIMIHVVQSKCKNKSISCGKNIIYYFCNPNDFIKLVYCIEL